jgi:polyphosphate kinase 2 (PPK2 family)
VAVVFKDGVTKRITKCLSPRVCRVDALGTPIKLEETRPAEPLLEFVVEYPL